jgi:predicted RNA-binding protein YlqC (UPF0109 family)
LKDLIELTSFIVNALVREPDAVSVTLGDRRGEPVIAIEVGEADRGAIIGRQGRTIRAIETVVRVAAGSDRAPGIEVA